MRSSLLQHGVGQPVDVRASAVVVDGELVERPGEDAPPEAA